MTVPALSIVLPVYNGERFLREQLDSILQQSFADFELIAVDDGSSDGSFAMLQAHAARDSRVRLFRNEANRGLARTLEAYLPLARANSVALSDQDDVWLPEKLAKLMAAAGRHAAAYCDSELIDEHGAPLGMGLLEAVLFPSPASGHDPFALLGKNCVSGHAMVFRRDLFPHFLPFLPSLPHDHQIAIAALAHGGLRFHPERLVRHRIHGANACNSGLLAARAAQLARPAKSGGPRVWRRRRHRAFLHQQLGYFCARGIAPQFWLQLLDPARFDTQWFDLRLFWLLLRQPALSGYAPPLRRLLRACKHAKGARWYALGEARAHT